MRLGFSGKRKNKKDDIMDSPKMKQGKKIWECVSQIEACQRLEKMIKYKTGMENYHRDGWQGWKMSATDISNAGIDIDRVYRYIASLASEQVQHLRSHIESSVK